MSYTLQGNQEKLKTALTRAKHMGKRLARTGKLNSATGNVEPMLNILPREGMVWVRFEDNLSGDAAPAYHKELVNFNEVDIPIWVDHNPYGEWEVTGLQDLEAYAKYGGQTSGIATAERTITETETVSTLALDMLRPRRGNGQTIVVGEWVSKYGYLPETSINLSGDAPVSGGVSRWVVVYVDSASLTLLKLVSGDLTPENATKSAIATLVATTPANGVPVVAALVYAGQTSFARGELVDVRPFFS